MGFMARLRTNCHFGYNFAKVLISAAAVSCMEWGPLTQLPVAMTLRPKAGVLG